MRLIRAYRNLNRTIEGYGYEYSFRRLMLSSAAIISLGVLMGYYYRLKPIAIMVLVLYVFALFPTIIVGQFRMLANNDSFEQLSSYMDHMIIAFKRAPKILAAMEATYPTTDGHLRECLEQAMSIIREDNSEGVYLKAFALIENEYRTSRLRTLHRFLLNVEMENSVSYQQNIDTLYYDIHNWVTRVYSFQSRLKQAKLSIAISIGIALMIIAYFSQTLAGLGASIRTVNVTSGVFYQLETLAFLIILIGLYVMVNSKLNGVWLIEDMKTQEDEKIGGIIRSCEEYEDSFRWSRTIMMSMPLLLVTAAGFLKGSRLVVLAGVVLTLWFATGSRRKQSARKRQVRKSLLREFPAWLRDVSVNLHNMVGVNAIASSYSNAPSVMKPFIARFVERIEQDPVSMAPYDDFFGEFRVQELATSIKTMYSLQSMSREDAQRQVNDLTERNQELIARSEELRLKDTTSSITFLAAVPMLAMTGKLMCDMAIVLMQIVNAF